MGLAAPRDVPGPEIQPTSPALAGGFLTTRRAGKPQSDFEQTFIISPNCMSTSLVAQTVKRLPAVQETWVQSLRREDSLEKEMATHSSTFGWKIPWMEEPGRLQSMGLQRVRHTTKQLHSLFKLHATQCARSRGGLKGGQSPGPGRQELPRVWPCCAVPTSRTEKYEPGARGGEEEAWLQRNKHDLDPHLCAWTNLLFPQ